MMRKWNIPKQLFPPRQWGREVVLLEYNGPQLTAIESSGDVYLSLASDGDDTATRWLRAKVTESEMYALRTGGTTIRECLLKPIILVVDTGSDGEVISETIIGPNNLTEDDLPTRESFLPRGVIDGWSGLG